MGSFRKISLAAAALVMSASAGHAADIIEAPEYVPPAVGGWYLRGDIGYAHIRTGSVEYYQGTPTLTGSFEQHDIDSTWMVGGGIGYQVTDYFRVDLTADHYFNTDFNGSSATGAACTNAGVAGEICDYSDNGDVNITTLMANAYIDLGNYGGITPYVGAGIGGAMVHWGDLVNDETCVLNCGGYTEVSSTHGGYADWHFAWAAHAGFSYDLTHNLKLDAGYTYTHINGGRMFAFDAANTYTGQQGFNGDIEIHAVKAGLRYTFN